MDTLASNHIKKGITMTDQKVKTELLEPVEELLSQARILEEVQLALEPLRDEALNKKEFFNGFSACAEHMIKLVVGKMQFCKDEAERKKIIEEAERKAIEEEQRALKEAAAKAKPTKKRSAKKKKS